MKILESRRLEGDVLWELLIDDGAVYHAVILQVDRPAHIRFGSRITLTIMGGAVNQSAKVARELYEAYG